VQDSWCKIQNDKKPKSQTLSKSKFKNLEPINW
jgi:hypothetical protein